MKTLIQIETEKQELSLLDRLSYEGNNVFFNGKNLLSETNLCLKGEHKVSSIVCGHLIRGNSKQEILESDEVKFLTEKYEKPSIEWFFPLP